MDDILKCLRAAASNKQKAKRDIWLDNFLNDIASGVTEVKRGKLLDSILLDLGQPLPPQFDHGDFDF